MPTDFENHLQRQQSFLLHQLATTSVGTLTQSAVNQSIPKQIGAELGLNAKTANDLRAKMIVAGWLNGEKVNRVFTYFITEAGRKQLRELERYLPLMPAKGKLNLPADDHMRVTREVYILAALNQAPDRMISKSDLEVGFGGKGKPKAAELTAKQPHLAMFRDQSCLGLNPATTRAVLTDLALRGQVQVHRTADSESYSLTPSGAELLERSQGECPVLPPSGKPTLAPTESVRLGREAFVLLKLLQCVKNILWGSDAAAGSYPKPLKLNHATAWKVRDELAQKGHIAVQWDGKEGCYKLTPTGKQYLATLPFDALEEVKIKGSALTELLAASREGAKPATREIPPQVTLTVEQLVAPVLEIFYELLRERFTVLDMVPIHEIRRAVAEQFGPHAASHAVFDEVLFDLRRAKKLWLVSISDRSRATPEQLQDSVPGVGETFFYAEKAHAPIHA
jgi:predicted transcriptional regulator